MFDSPLVQDILRRNAAVGLAVGTVQRIEVVQKTTWPQPVTVQVRDGEVVSECNHAGADNIDVSVEEFDPDSGRYPLTGTAVVLMCDKENCNAQYDPINEEWLS